MFPHTVVLALTFVQSFALLFDRGDLQMPQTFADVQHRYECVTLNGVRTDRVETRGDETVVDFTVDATGYLPMTHAPREFPPHWRVRYGGDGQIVDAAIPEAEVAQQLAQHQPLRPEQSEYVDRELARQLCELAYATALKSDYKTSGELANAALVLAREVAPDEVPRALWYIARAADSIGDDDAALGPATESVKLAVAVEDKPLEARTLITFAWVHLSMENYAKAKEPFHAGIRLAEHLGEHVPASEGYLGLANMAVAESDDTITALRHYASALEHAQAANHLPLQGAALGNMGAIYNNMANFLMAESYYKRAVELYRRANNLRGIVRNTRNLADIEESAGHVDAALRHARETDELLKQYPHPRTAMYNAITWSKLYMRRNQLDLAEKKCNEAAAAADAAHHTPLQTYTKFTMAKIRYRQHRYRESLALAEATIAACLKAPNFDTYWSAKVLAGDNLWRLGDRKRAHAEYQDAVDAIEFRRANVPGSGENEQVFFEDKAAAYYAVFRATAAEGKIDEAVRWVERARAKTLLESLARGKVKSTRYLSAEESRDEQQIDAELTAANVALRDARTQEQPDARTIARLENELEQKRIARTALTARLYTNHPELSLVRGDVPTPSIAELRRVIPRDGVVLEYVVDVERTSLIVITRDEEPRIIPIPITLEKLQRAAELFSDDVAKSNLDYKPQARRLYNLLVAPAASVLRKKNIVCILTDSVLNGVPFQALVAPDGRHFIEHHAIFYAPSLALLSWYSTHDSPPAGEARRTLLAIGNPQLSKETVKMARAVRRDERLVPLFAAEDEVRRIATLFGRNETLLLTGPRATETRFKEEAGRYRILHLATHGVFDDAMPMYSHVVLARGPNDADDGLLEAREIAQLDLHADLAILSSCETGRGLALWGEGMIGMSWALLAAGCPRSVLTQWKIDSSSARDLMIGFHRQLATHQAITGRAATEALRRAQMGMLKRSRFAHPFHWSAFILFGDGW